MTSDWLLIVWNGFVVNNFDSLYFSNRICWLWIYLQSSWYLRSHLHRTFRPGTGDNMFYFPISTFLQLPQSHMWRDSFCMHSPPFKLREAVWGNIARALPPSAETATRWSAPTATGTEVLRSNFYLNGGIEIKLLLDQTTFVPNNQRRTRIIPWNCNMWK